MRTPSTPALSRALNRDYPPSGEEYLARKKPYITNAEFLIVCLPAVATYMQLEDVQRWLDAIRSVKKIQDKVLPAFVAVRRSMDVVGLMHLSGAGRTCLDGARLRARKSSAPSLLEVR